MALLPTNIVIIGTGKVATAFVQFFLKTKGVNITVIGRNVKKLKDFELCFSVNTSDDFNDSSVDWAIVAVSDDALKEVIPKIKARWISLAAATADYRIYGPNCSILYPLQTFASNSDIALESVPFIVDGDEIAMEKVRCWTKKLSLKTQHLSLVEREKMHLVAVFLNNFVHHLLAKGINLAKEYELNPAIYSALINATFERFDINDPFAQQTGPAERNDEITMNTHRKYLLEADLKLYNMLSSSIKLAKDEKL